MNLRQLHNNAMILVRGILQVLTKVSLDVPIVKVLENEVCDKLLSNMFEIVRATVAFCFRQMFARALRVMAEDDTVANLVVEGIVLEFQFIVCLQSRESDVK
jgi:hypothetical protein